MKKEITITLIFILFMLSFLIIFIRKDHNKNPEVCIKDSCFKVTLAYTPEKRAEGLMYQEELPEDSGMLFIFDKEDKYGFWMKNTLIPLDIIWISKNKTIVYVIQNTQPCLNENCTIFYPKENTKYILEINANISGEARLKTGQKVTFKG